MLAGAEVFRVASRPITPLGTFVVLVSMAALVIVLTRSRPGLIILALLGGYAARRAGLRTGFVKWLDHRVLERLSETFDNVEGWLVAFAACSAVLLLFHLWPRGQPGNGHR
jgi:hypothetical protein